MHTWLNFFLLKISIEIIIVSFFNICMFSFLSPINIFPLFDLASIISSVIKFYLVQTFVSHEFYSYLQKICSTKALVFIEVEILAFHFPLAWFKESSRNAISFTTTPLSNNNLKSSAN
jgi:hypothetical protein